MRSGNDKDDHDGGDGGGDRKTVKAISERDFNTLLKKIRSAQADMDSGRGTIGNLISDAVQNKHLHKGALGIFRRLDKMDAYKRAELKFHLDLYIERAKWDDTDLFEDRDPQAAE